MKLNEISPFEYDKYTFGKIITARRKELGLSLRETAKILEMSEIYLTDIEKGHRNPPIGVKGQKDYMSKFITILQIPDEEVEAFYDIAYCSKYGISKRINDYINSNKYAQEAILLAMKQNLSDAEWQEILSQMRKR